MRKEETAVKPQVEEAFEAVCALLKDLEAQWVYQKERWGAPGGQGGTTATRADAAVEVAIPDGSFADTEDSADDGVKGNVGGLPDVMADLDLSRDLCDMPALIASLRMLRQMLQNACDAHHWSLRRMRTAGEHATYALIEANQRYCEEASLSYQLRSAASLTGGRDGLAYGDTDAEACWEHMPFVEFRPLCAALLMDVEHVTLRRQAHMIIHGTCKNKDKEPVVAHETAVAPGPHTVQSMAEIRLVDAAVKTGADTSVQKKEEAAIIQGIVGTQGEPASLTNASTRMENALRATKRDARERTDMEAEDKGVTEKMRVIFRRNAQEIAKEKQAGANEREAMEREDHKHVRLNQIMGKLLNVFRNRVWPSESLLEEHVKSSVALASWEVAVKSIFSQTYLGLRMLLAMDALKHLRAYGGKAFEAMHAKFMDLLSAALDPVDSDVTLSTCTCHVCIRLMPVVNGAL